MLIRNEVAEVLNGFEKRMKFINIVRFITEYKYPVVIKAMFGSDTEKDKLTNIVLAVLVYIKERTLGEDLDCTLSNVQQFLEDLFVIFPESNYDCGVLAKYIIVDILQHGGEISTFQTYSDTSNTFEMLPIRLINEEHGKYTLTDDAFDFLFRIKDIDSTLDYSVTRFKMQEYMKRDNYSEALEQSRELVSRIRNIKTGMNSFILLCRENISKVSIDEYESLITRIRALLEDEYKELIEIQKNAEERAEKLSSASTAGVSYEDARKHRNALHEIIKNIEVTIEEQRSLINRKTSLTKQYGEILRESYRIVSFEHLSFQEDIMIKLRHMTDLGDVAKFFLFPLTKPELEKRFSVENFYASQKSYDDMEDKESFNLNDTEESTEILLIEKRNERYQLITEELFSFIKGKTHLTTLEFIESLRVSQLSYYCEEKALPQMLLSLFEIGEIDITEWKETSEIELIPMGEFELTWCLRQLPDELLDMQKIVISKMDKDISFSYETDQLRQEIEMSLLSMEIIR